MDTAVAHAAPRGPARTLSARKTAIAAKTNREKLMETSRAVGAHVVSIAYLDIPAVANVHLAELMRTDATARLGIRIAAEPLTQAAEHSLHGFRGTARQPREDTGGDRSHNSPNDNGHCAPPNIQNPSRNAMMPDQIDRQSRLSPCEAALPFTSKPIPDVEVAP
ncbi:hypothetical protein [Streptomyces pseudovenezuelae]|uniref:hypothetical protein n=1 Tax=Streptomyces pseudovenezuelae TaxID=67350 RepID=UPI00371CEA8B